MQWRETPHKKKWVAKKHEENVAVLHEYLNELGILSTLNALPLKLHKDPNIVQLMLYNKGLDGNIVFLEALIQYASKLQKTDGCTQKICSYINYQLTIAQPEMLNNSILNHSNEVTKLLLPQLKADEITSALELALKSQNLEILPWLIDKLSSDNNLFVEYTNKILSQLQISEDSSPQTAQAKTIYKKLEQSFVTYTTSDSVEISKLQNLFLSANNSSYIFKTKISKEQQFVDTLKYSELEYGMDNEDLGSMNASLELIGGGEVDNAS